MSNKQRARSLMLVKRHCFCFCSAVSCCLSGKRQIQLYLHEITIVWLCVFASVFKEKSLSFTLSSPDKASPRRSPRKRNQKRSAGSDEWRVPDTSATNLHPPVYVRRGGGGVRATWSALPYLLRNFNQCQAQQWLAVYFQLKNCWI